MREIKFRAWHRAEKRWIHQFDIYRFSQIVEADGSSGLKIPLDIGIDVEVVQFTGLRDKNGDEIFEDDIVSHSRDNQNYLVKWIDGSCGWGLRFGDRTMMLSHLCEQYMEVIGNIHENSDLLPDAQKPEWR